MHERSTPYSWSPTAPSQGNNPMAHKPWPMRVINYLTTLQPIPSQAGTTLVT